MTAWSNEQDAALKAIAAWRARGDSQVFRLFGYAGTGKTTLARHIADDVDGDVVYGAYTGKAASVMRSRGCRDAATIHSIIYRAKEGDEGGPSFVLNRSSTVAKADLVIIDECSMVDEELGRDLLSFGTPVLVLGDPAQLPPVKGGGFFTEAEPDAMLTEVHRQARGNPIIDLSMRVRMGERLERGVYGESRVISRREIESEDVAAADQVLVGLNRTRQLYNRRLRELLNYYPAGPQVGDRLVCLRNDRTKGLLNGTGWVVQAMRPAASRYVRMDIAPEDDRNRVPTDVSVREEYFDGREEELSFSERRESDAFTYGYALTVHKAQGSQWASTVLFDESYAFREHRARWLYTGLTRASERVIVVQ